MTDSPSLLKNGLMMTNSANAKPVFPSLDSMKSILNSMSPYAIKYSTLPILFEKLSVKEKWQIRVTSLHLIQHLAQIAPVQISACLPELIPKLAEQASDARRDISKAAEDALFEVCKCMQNKDIEPLIPVLVSCIARPNELEECIYKLSATTFVQVVEQPTLAILVPLLERGLRSSTSAIRRRAAVICDNMCKLVQNPAHASPLLPTLLPLLTTAKESTSDPEVREVCSKACATLQKAAKGSSTDLQKYSLDSAKEEILRIASPNDTKLKEEKEVLDYAASLMLFACELGDFSKELWHSELLTPILSPHVPNAAEVCEMIRSKSQTDLSLQVQQEEEDNDGHDLCKCEFSLAYGGKILLNQATLHLKTNHRYGLCGPNGCGKSTLLRAIANGQVEGFPSKDVVRTAVVEHDLDGSLDTASIVDYLVQSLEITPEKAFDQLKDVGFTENVAIASLSGGWKMKLALSKAILQEPHILLLDEPTNHLDVANVAWLTNYLVTKCQNVSCLIVSHDTKFLDNVCTDILHYDSFKLKKYKGNLSAFVAVHPEAMAYLSLENSALQFQFPSPGFLEGVSTKGKAILKMTGVDYTYPGTEKKILNNVSLVCSLSSRVGCIGPNGAGKSTLIKILTGEIIPDTGSVWKHPNVRIAYVAQHAFHHLEEHLDMTPSEYIQWRFASGEDRESLEKAANKITDQEEKKMASQIVLDGAKFVVEQVHSRRKLRSTFEYETSFVGMTPDKNKWLPRSWLEENGFGKLVDRLDAQEAAAAGLHSTPLTSANIAKHLSEVGLDAEFTLHHRMRGLSGGQKVKVVLGAACWQHPHLIVLDEPTNYLDRDSLGALAGALKQFEGGVVIISHAGEFIDATTTEKWIVGGGVVKVEGETWSLATAKLTKDVQAEEVVDAAGNVIKVEKQLTDREKKQKEKEKIKRRKEKAKMRARGEQVSSDSEDFD
jgi:elongation factor 3